MSKNLFVYASRRQVVFGLAAVAIGSTGSHNSFAEAVGSYRGRIVAEWLENGRDMRLLEPFEYRGPDGRRWPVPSGVVVDGASIPQAFWSLIGGPFEGIYRAASVVHDRYCQTRTRKSVDVHRVFYDGMLTSGVGSKRAWIMHQAVLRFGPSWADPRIDARCEVVDENYDFELCAQNAARPAVQRPDASRDKLLQFLNDVEAQSDPADIATLRQRFSS